MKRSQGYLGGIARWQHPAVVRISTNLFVGAGDFWYVRVNPCRKSSILVASHAYTVQVLRFCSW